MDLNKGNYDIQTPLHLAVLYGRQEAVQFLVQVQVAGVRVSPQIRWGATPISYVENNRLIEKYQIEIGATRGVNTTPLHTG